MPRRAAKVSTEQPATIVSNVTAIVAGDPPIEQPPSELVDVVFRLVLCGHTEQFIRNELERNHPEQAAEPLIFAAMKRFHDSGEFNPQIMRGWCVEAYREIYRNAMEFGDTKLAIVVVKQLARMAGE